MASFIAYCVTVGAVLSGNMMLGQKEFEIADLFVNLVTIICVALLLQWLWLFGEYEKSCMENKMAEALQMMTQKYNGVIEESYQQNARKSHDAKHCMLGAIACLEKGEIETAKDMLKKYMGQQDCVERKIWTGFPVLDYILDYKKMEMDKNKITFTFEQELYAYPFDDAQMGVVIGNLLDNAIEAAMQCEPERRIICVTMKNINDMFFLKVKNSTTTLPKQEKGRFVTSKSNRKVHGLGIESVKRIVQKYEGSIDFQYDRELFEVNILI